MSFSALEARVHSKTLDHSICLIRAICPELLVSPPSDPKEAVIVLKFLGVTDPDVFLSYLDFTGVEITDPSNTNDINIFIEASVPTFETKFNEEFPTLGDALQDHSEDAKDSESEKLIDDLCQPRIEDEFEHELLSFLKEIEWFDDDGVKHFSQYTGMTGEFDKYNYDTAGEILRWFISRNNDSRKILAKIFASHIGVFVSCVHSGSVFTPSSSFVTGTYHTLLKQLEKGDYAILPVCEIYISSKEAWNFFGWWYPNWRYREEFQAAILPFSELSLFMFEVDDDSDLRLAIKTMNRETVLESYDSIKNFIEMSIENNHKIVNVGEFREELQRCKRQLIEISQNYRVDEIDDLVTNLDMCVA